MKQVLAEDQGTPKMIEIATAIQEGAAAYLKRQFRTIIMVLVPLTVVVFITSQEVIKPAVAEQNGAGRPVLHDVRVRRAPSPSSPAPSCPASPATSA